MILYWHPIDEDQVVGQPQTTFFAEDQNAEWWVGVYQCALPAALSFASLVALQTAQAINLLDIPQDDTALHGQYDEDFWENPVAPVPGFLGRIYLPDPEEIPAGNLTATVDEYFWVNPADSCYTINVWPQQFTFETNDVVVVAATFQPDEDFWENPVAPVFGSLYQFLPLGVDEQTPTLYGQYDEDFWQNPTAPVAGSLLYVQQSSFDEQYPVLHGQYDEDFWINPVAPVPGSLLYVKQSSFDEQYPVLYGQFDEDFWTNPVSHIPAYYWPQPFGFDANEIASSVVVTPIVDEDFWLNGLISVPSCYTRNFLPIQWSFDQNEKIVFVPLVVALLDFPDTILLDIASDPTYPVSFQIRAIQTLLRRQADGREVPQYVSTGIETIRSANITYLLNLRSSTNSTFAQLLAQQQALFTS